MQVLLRAFHTDGIFYNKQVKDTKTEFFFVKHKSKNSMTFLDFGENKVF